MRPGRWAGEKETIHAEEIQEGLAEECQTHFYLESLAAPIEQRIQEVRAGAGRQIRGLQLSWGALTAP